MRKRLIPLFRSFWRKEHGESLLIVAFAITALIGMSATAADMGAAYVKTAQTQTATDAAVLAAGMKLPVKSGDTAGIEQVKAVARDYLTKNGVEDASQATITLGDLSGGAYHSILVSQPAMSETAFARIFGINEITFRRQAESKVVPCAALSDLVPLSIQKSTLDAIIADGTSQHAILKYGSNTDDVETARLARSTSTASRAAARTTIPAGWLTGIRQSWSSEPCCPWNRAT